MAKLLTHLAMVLLLIGVVLACSTTLGSCSRGSSSSLFGGLQGGGGGACSPSGYLPGKTHHCNTEHDSDCCKAGEKYPQYQCSPPATGNTHAHMTINSFAKGGDGGGPSECDNSYHSDAEMVVALSTGWYNHGSRCLKQIRINANGKTVLAKVVDECDSVHGCDADHDFQPPCPNNIVDASPAVWEALGVPNSDVGDLDITWSDA